MEKTALKTPESSRLESVTSTFNLLEIMGRRDRAMAVSELARVMGRAKSSVHRMLTTLILCGYVEQETEHGRYRLTTKLWRVGSSAFHNRDLVDIARHELEQLMVSSDETVHLAILDSDCVVYIHKVESPRSIRVQTRIGAEAPSVSTATGRALLAHRPAVLEAVLSKPVRQRTEDTITDPDRILEEIQNVISAGYSVTKRENHPEMGGIAAPIFDFSGDVIASTGVAIPIFRMNDELVERCVPLVRKAAMRISQNLGFEAQ